MGEPPRRILMTADTIGGVWTYALELARSLGPRGYEVALATMGEPLTPTQKEEAAADPALRIFENRYKLEWMPEPWSDVDAAGEWLLALANEYQPDLIHLNGYAHAALPWGQPFLVVAHSCVCSWWRAVKGEPAPPEWDAYRRRVVEGLRRTRLVVAPTRAMLDAISAEYGAQPGAITVIANARDPQLFLPAEKEPFIFAAGRLGDAAKNVATLAALAPELPWPIYVAGRESDPSGHTALPVGVHSLGHLPAPELALWLGRAAIYCLPARYEPFGLSILEAALARCALVLGDIPSLRELWEGAAIFVPPGAPAALAHALRQLIASPAERTRLADAAHARALAFTPARQADAYDAVYRRLIRDHAALSSSPS